jgi:hypothetical protein
MAYLHNPKGSEFSHRLERPSPFAVYLQTQPLIWILNADCSFDIGTNAGAPPRYIRPRSSSLHCGLNAPPAASLTRRPQTCRLGVFFASLKLTDRFGDLRLYQEDLIAIWVLKIKPLYG